jgi:hypothetical protein
MRGVVEFAERKRRDPIEIWSKSRMAAKWLAALALAGTFFLGGAALAQGVAPSAPEDDNANSAAAMQDTVNDPRIGGPKGTWDMWDIGRPHPMKGKGAFGDHDPIGIAAGKLIPTDCSLYWADPDTHRILCFGSQASLLYFLSAPKANEARAEKHWRLLNGKTS